jgi:hypothetical protein
MRSTIPGAFGGGVVQCGGHGTHRRRREEREMAEQPTCGEGLAAHAVLPAGLAKLTEAMADNLQVHMKALDLDDEAARQEHSVYLRLAEELRQVSARLETAGGEMADARTLPMGRHDPEAMTSPEVAEAFRRFVRAKQELLVLLQGMVEQDQRMLAEMGGQARLTG